MKERRADPADVTRILSRLRSLSRPSAKALLPHQQLRAIANDLVRTEEFKQAQLNSFRIYVAGFLYFDEASRKVDYQFFGETRGGQSEYTLKYVWEPGRTLGPFGEGLAAEEKAAQFIDSLFFVMRENQSPWPPKVGRWRIPEYLAWLPQRGIDSDTQASSSRNALRDLYGWHYCPYGEVVFFLYMWRLLLWTSVCFPSPVECDWPGMLSAPGFGRYIDASRRQKNINGLWEGRHWKKESDEYEHILYQWTFEGTGNFSKPEIVQQGLAFFDVPSNPESVWNQDLKHLLLYDGLGGKGAALLPALRYARGVLAASLHEFPEQPAFLRKRTLWDADFRFRGDGVDDVDQYLRFAAVAWLQSSMAGNFNLWEDAIEQLHYRSRFPIIPYFYWNAIDQKPKTHVVVPIWRSWTAPIRTDIFTEEPNTPLGVPRKEQSVFTSIVGVSVVAMEPLIGDLQSEDQDPYYIGLTQAGDWQRVNWIDEVLLRASLPQVDDHYYGDLERARENQGRASQQASISHDQHNPLEVMASLLESSQLADGDRILCARALANAMRQKLSSYSAFAGMKYTKENWAAEAAYTFADSRRVSEIFNWSVLVALLWTVVDSTFFRLRSALFDVADVPAWECFRGQIEKYLRSGRGPQGNLLLQNTNGKTTVRVQYTGEDPLIPYRSEGHGGGPPITRAYAGFTFLLDEIVLNTFKHQYKANGALVEKRGEVRLSVNIMPTAVDSSEEYSMAMACSPVRPECEAEPLIRARATGLESLDFVLNKLGFVAETSRQFRLSAGGSAVTKLLPYWEDREDARVWVISNIPAEVFVTFPSKETT